MHLLPLIVAESRCPRPIANPPPAATPCPRTPLFNPQLERKGYFIVDVPFSSADKPMVLLNIPDGRARVFPGMPSA